jgi:hypothetical protein
VALADLTVEAFEVLDVDVRTLLNDDRKIPWLWAATATVKFNGKPGNPDEAPESHSWLWKRVFRYAPQATKIAEGACWLEITDSRTRRTTRSHYELSEWTETFRAKVVSDWRMMLKRHERDAGGETAKVNQGDLRIRKEALANKFNISIEECQEILESTR